MDLNLCYCNFVVDDRELMFHSVMGTVPSYHDEEGNLYCTAAAFQHPWQPALERWTIPFHWCQWRPFHVCPVGSGRPWQSRSSYSTGTDFGRYRKCLPARSTLILLSFSGQGEMNFKIKSVILCHNSHFIHYFVSLTSGVPYCTICWVSLAT